MGAGASAVSTATQCTKEQATAAIVAAFAEKETCSIGEILHVGMKEAHDPEDEEPDPPDEELPPAEEMPEEDEPVPDGAINWSKAIKSGMLSRDERAQRIKQLFEELDDDGDMMVKPREFMKAMREYGMEAKKVKKLFHKIDTTHSGKITFAKFEAYAANRTSELIRKAFHEADADGNRQISKQEFSHFFLAGGVSKKSIAPLWAKLDANGNGKVSYVEYRDWAETCLDEETLTKIWGGVE